MNYYQRLLYPREIAYFWKEIVFTLILLGVMFLFGIVASLPLIAAQIMDSVLFMAFAGVAMMCSFLAFIIFISLRLLLVFPAISVDEKLEFHNSYKMLKGHTWRFFLCVALTCLPLLGLSFLIAPLLLLMPQSFISLSVIIIVQSGFGFLLTVPVLAAMGYVFQRIQEN